MLRADTGPSLCFATVHNERTVLLSASSWLYELGIVKGTQLNRERYSCWSSIFADEAITTRRDAV
jgi:hypothetical protein